MVKAIDQEYVLQRWHSVPNFQPYLELRPVTYPPI